MSKPRYLFLFIVFSLLNLPLSVIIRIGADQNAVAFVAITYGLMIIIYVISAFLVAGVYSSAWKNLKGESANILEEAKIYFPRILVVTFFIGFLSGLLSTFVFIFKADGSFISNVYFIRAIPVLIAILFFYASPAIIVANLTAIGALGKAWRFIISHFVESGAVIFLLLLSSVGGIIFAQWAGDFDKSSIQYWQIITVGHILSYFLTFLAFLTAAQIFEKSTR